MIIATRNRLIHGYLSIDNDTLWSIIQKDIPALLPKLRALRDVRPTNEQTEHNTDPK
jgi:uncharacterized protein with HEPN domain